MSAKVSGLRAFRRPLVLLTILGMCGVAAAWAIVFFLPQSHKLTELQQEKVTLDATIARDNARVAKLQTEQQHVTEIKAMYHSLQGYVPTSSALYTYVHTISAAAKSAHVTITALGFGQPTKIEHSSYEAIPVTATVKGRYSSILALIQDVYALSRLTDINSVSLQGSLGGTVSVNFGFAIFISGG